MIDLRGLVSDRAYSRAHTNAAGFACVEGLVKTLDVGGLNITMDLTKSKTGGWVACDGTSFGGEEHIACFLHVWPKRPDPRLQEIRVEAVVGFFGGPSYHVYNPLMTLRKTFSNKHGAVHGKYRAMRLRDFSNLLPRDTSRVPFKVEPTSITRRYKCN